MATKNIALIICLFYLGSCVVNNKTDLPAPSSLGSIIGYGETNIMGQDSKIEILYNSVIDAAGDDNILFTGDDEIHYYTSVDYYNNSIDDNTASDKIRYYVTETGDDNAWFTADDVIHSAKVPVLQEGKLVGYNIYNSAGDDGLWHTEDDKLNEYIRLQETTDAHDNPVSYINEYRSRGDDSVWFTNDDILSSQQKTYIDHEGLAVTCNTTYHVNTTDSTFTSCEKVLLIDEEKNISYRLSYSSQAGNDADAASQLVAEDIDTVSLHGFGIEADIPVKTYNIHAHPGNDGEWLTDDDILPYMNSMEIISRSDTEVTGQLVGTTAGSNGVLGDGDDEIDFYTLFELTLDERKYTIKWSSGSSGNDNEWFTEDDVLTPEYIEYHFIK